MFVRVLLCCAIATNMDNYMYNDNTATLWCVIISIILILIWFFMFYFAITFYITREHTTSGVATANNTLNGIGIIASNDKESIIFCKELGIDTYLRIKIIKNMILMQIQPTTYWMQ